MCGLMKLLLLHRLLLRDGITVCDELESSEKEMIVVAYFISLSPTIRAVQLVESLRYKPECRRFDGITGIFALAYSVQPLTEMNIRNIFWGVKDSRSLGLTAFPHSRADLLEVCKSQPLGTLCVCNRSVQGLLYLSPVVIPVAARSKMWVCGLSLSRIAGSNSARVICNKCDCI
jgi:hypothetical protein